MILREICSGIDTGDMVEYAFELFRLRWILGFIFSRDNNIKKCKGTFFSECMHDY